MNRYKIRERKPAIRIADNAVDAFESYQAETPFGKPRRWEITAAKLNQYDADTGGEKWAQFVTPDQKTILVERVTS